MKSTPPTPPVPEKKQIDKFRDLAQELECDDDDEAFAQRLKKIATAKPPKRDPISNQLGAGRLGN